MTIYFNDYFKAIGVHIAIRDGAVCSVNRYVNHLPVIMVKNQTDDVLRSMGPCADIGFSESRFGRNVSQVAGFSHQTAPALYIVFVHNGRKNVPTIYRELSLAMPIEEPGSLYLSSGIDSES
jgi:hypothetical protein